MSEKLSQPLWPHITECTMTTNEAKMRKIVVPLVQGGGVEFVCFVNSETLPGYVIGRTTFQNQRALHSFNQFYKLLSLPETSKYNQSNINTQLPPMPNKIKGYGWEIIGREFTTY